MDENFKSVFLCLSNANEDHNYNETLGFPMVHLKEDSDGGDDFQMSLLKEESVEDDSTSENAEESISDGRSSATWTAARSVNIIYPCYLCNFETCRSTSLVAHLRQHRQSGLILETERFQIGKFVCHICNFKTRWLSSLKEHEENVHFSNNDSINSALNDDNGDNYNNINSSNSSNGDHDDYLSKCTSYNCRLCGFSAEKLDNLTAHMKRHFTFINVFGNLVRNYPCCLCEYTTRQFDELQAHVNSVHNSSSFNDCPVLVQTSRTKCTRFEQLFDHCDDAVSHSPKNEENLSPGYPCDYCSHRAASIYLWRDHMESHGGVLEISISSVHD